MYKRILLIDNFDSFTFNLVDYLEQLGCEVLVYRNTVDPKIVAEINPDLLLFSPGPSVPKSAGNLMKIIDIYKEQYPMFGVCLGLEAFVEAFGGTLKLTDPVHGVAYPIKHDGQRVFAGLKENFRAGRYHSLVTDKLPDCFDVTATCMGNQEELIMAIRHKQLPIEAVQFHPESVLTMEDGQGLKLLENLIQGRWF